MGLCNTAHELCQGNEEIMIAGGLITESKETAGSLRAAFQAANDCERFITVWKGYGMEMVKQICARMNQFATKISKSDATMMQKVAKPLEAVVSVCSYEDGLRWVPFFCRVVAAPWSEEDAREMAPHFMAMQDSLMSITEKITSLDKSLVDRLHSVASGDQVKTQNSLLSETAQQWIASLHDRSLITKAMDTYCKALADYGDDPSSTQVSDACSELLVETQFVGPI